MELWRDDKRLPLAKLNEAMATYSADGQVDDASGGEAGTQAALDEAQRERRPAMGDPDPDSAEGRRERPTPDGRPGPN